MANTYKTVINKAIQGINTLQKNLASIGATGISAPTVDTNGNVTGALSLDTLVAADAVTKNAVISLTGTATGAISASDITVTPTISVSKSGTTNSGVELTGNSNISFQTDKPTDKYFVAISRSASGSNSTTASGTITVGTISKSVSQSGYINSTKGTVDVSKISAGGVTSKTVKATISGGSGTSYLVLPSATATNGTGTATLSKSGTTNTGDEITGSSTISLASSAESGKYYLKLASSGSGTASVVEGYTRGLTPSVTVSGSSILSLTKATLSAGSGSVSGSNITFKSTETTDSGLVVTGSGSVSVSEGYTKTGSKSSNSASETISKISIAASKTLDSITNKGTITSISNAGTVSVTNYITEGSTTTNGTININGGKVDKGVQVIGKTTSVDGTTVSDSSGDLITGTYTATHTLSAGSGSVSGANIKLMSSSDTGFVDSGITVSGSGSVSATGTATVSKAGWIATGSKTSTSSSKSSNTATKYITEITVPTEKTLNKLTSVGTTNIYNTDSTPAKIASITGNVITVGSTAITNSGSGSLITVTPTRSGNTVSWGSGWVSAGSSTGTTTSRAAGTTSITPGNAVLESSNNSGISIKAQGSVSTGTGWITSGSTNSTESTQYIKEITVPTGKTLDKLTSVGTTNLYNTASTPAKFATIVNSVITVGTATITNTSGSLINAVYSASGKDLSLTPTIAEADKSSDDINIIDNSKVEILSAQDTTKNYYYVKTAINGSAHFTPEISVTTAGYAAKGTTTGSQATINGTAQTKYIGITKGSVSATGSASGLGLSLTKVAPSSGETDIISEDSTYEILDAKNSEKDYYYLKTNVARTGSVSLSKTVTEGYVTAAEVSTGNSVSIAGNTNKYIGITKSTLSASGGGLTPTNYSATPTVTISNASDTNASNISISTSKPSSGYYYKVSSSSSKLTGTTKVTRAAVSAKATAGYTKGSSTSIAESSSSPTVTVNAGSTSAYITIPSGTLTAALPANITDETTYKEYTNSGKDSSGTTTGTVSAIPTGGYLYISGGYYPNIKISLGTLIPDDSSLTNAGSAQILKNYEAYDSNGNKLVGTIETITPSDTYYTTTNTGYGVINIGYNKTVNYIKKGSHSATLTGESGVLTLNETATTGLKVTAGSAVTTAGWLVAETKTSNKYITDIKLTSGKVLSSVALTGTGKISSVILGDSTTTTSETPEISSVALVKSGAAIKKLYITAGSANIYNKDGSAQIATLADSNKITIGTTLVTDSDGSLKTTSATVSGATVSYGTGWITSGSKSVATGAYSASASVTATASATASNAVLSSTNNSGILVTATGTASGTGTATISTAGYITAGSKTSSPAATASKTDNKYIDQITVASGKTLAKATNNGTITELAGTGKITTFSGTQTISNLTGKVDIDAAADTGIVDYVDWTIFRNSTKKCLEFQFLG